MVERIESGETADKAFGLIGNRVAVRTLEFNFGIGACWARVAVLSARKGL